MNKLARLFSMLLPLAWLLAGCTPIDKRLAQYPIAQESYPALVKIVDYLQARGYRLVYYVSSKEIVVVYEDDLGSARKLLHRQSLKGPQADKLVSFINQIPLTRLNERYVNPEMNDGLVMWFDFALPNRPRKVIEIRNTHQQQLFELTERINAALPRKFWIRRPRPAVKGTATYVGK
jgi:hypothetical protein